MPHKTSITHQLETDIPGSPLQIPRICLTRKSKNSRSILKTGFVGHWSRNLAFGKKKKKSSRFPSDRVVPSPKTMSTLIQENLRVVPMAARLSFFFWLLVSGLSCIADGMEGIHVSEEFETDLQHTSSIKPLLTFTGFSTLNDLCCSCWWDQKKKTLIFSLCHVRQYVIQIKSVKGYK